MTNRQILVTIAAAMGIVLTAILYARMLHAQVLPPMVLQPGQSTTISAATPAPTPTPTPAPNVSIQVAPSQPAGSYAVVGTDAVVGSWVNFWADGKYVSSGKSSTWAWTWQGTPGAHKLQVQGFHGAGAVDGSASQTVTVPPVPTPSPTPSPATISGLTGSASSIAGADTDPTHFGSYTAPGGQGLIGGPLLDDVTAASFVVPSPPSVIETGSVGAANAALNNYFESIGVAHPAYYLQQLQGFWAAWQNRPSWYPEIQRVDGACPLINPTTAEIMQWASAKWGINPALAYAEVTHDGDWDQTALGDFGCSSGVTQIADLNTAQKQNHSFPGFVGVSANLSRQNTCFSADLWAAHMWSVFHGLTGECPANPNDIGVAIQTWATGYGVCTPGGGPYTQIIMSSIASQDWRPRFFRGSPLPYDTVAPIVSGRNRRHPKR